MSPGQQRNNWKDASDRGIDQRTRVDFGSPGGRLGSSTFFRAAARDFARSVLRSGSGSPVQPATCVTRTAKACRRDKKPVVSTLRPARVMEFALLRVQGDRTVT